MKIGFTSQLPVSRAIEVCVRTGSPLRIVGVMPGTIKDELAIHRSLRSHAISGRAEWYYPNDEIKRLALLIDYPPRVGMSCRSWCGVCVFPPNGTIRRLTLAERAQANAAWTEARRTARLAEPHPAIAQARQRYTEIEAYRVDMANKQRPLKARGQAKREPGAAAAAGRTPLPLQQAKAV